LHTALCLERVEAIFIAVFVGLRISAKTGVNVARLVFSGYGNAVMHYRLFELESGLVLRIVAGSPDMLNDPDSRVYGVVLEGKQARVDLYHKLRECCAFEALVDWNEDQLFIFKEKNVTELVGLVDRLL
jgi:hypothetical protein